MKKSLLFVLMTALLFVWSCQPKVEDEVTITSSPNVTASVAGEVVTIAFNSNVPWTAETDAAWLTLNPTSGAAGDATVKASATKNETFDSRTATVTIKAGTASKTVKVVQGQTDAIEVATADFTVAAEGGAIEIPVSANVVYDVVIPEAVDWVTLAVEPTQIYDADENGAPTFNEDAIVRTATLTIKAGSLEKQVTVAQKGLVPCFDYEGDWAGLQWSFYEGSPVVFPQEGGTFVINVNTNIDWRAYFSVYDASIDAGVDVMENGWARLSFDKEASTITIEMDPNDSYFTREDYLYSVGIIDGEEDGNFGGLGWFTQAGKTIEGAISKFVWSKTLGELGIPAAYNRLAYTATGALLVSDGEKVHAISPADGTYWKAITYPGIIPNSICSDDAGNVIVVPDVTADIDWNTGNLLSGTELVIYYSANPNEMASKLVVPNLDYGVVGGVRVRGNLAGKAVITGVVGSAACWFGYDIQNYAAVSNYYGTQMQGPGPGEVFWQPVYAASVSLGTSLHDGVLFRAYDGKESLFYLADAYTPNWAVPYEWKLVTEAGSGGNENQNNMAIVDYKGKRVVAYTQGFHFDYSSNASIYVLDATDINDVKPLVTINPQEDVTFGDFTWQSSADVLLHPTDECLELYVINSGRAVIAKYMVLF